MTDMDQLRLGFEILAKYDDTKGDVSVNYDAYIFAGPQDMSEDDFDPDDVERLEELGWGFDRDISRWGWR